MKKNKAKKIGHMASRYDVDVYDLCTALGHDIEEADAVMTAATELTGYGMLTQRDAGRLKVFMWLSSKILQNAVEKIAELKRALKKEAE